jgi:hypothetical protein
MGRQHREVIEGWACVGYVPIKFNQNKKGEYKGNHHKKVVISNINKKKNTSMRKILKLLLKLNKRNKLNNFKKYKIIINKKLIKNQKNRIIVKIKIQRTRQKYKKTMQEQLNQKIRKQSAKKIRRNKETISNY